MFKNQKLTRIPVRADLVFNSLLIAACLGSFAGCGGPRLPTVAVTGTVTYKGAPLADADIGFVPKDKEAKGATAHTDSAGKFDLTTYVSGTTTYPGAYPGEYNVTVRKREDMTALLRPGGADRMSQVNKIQEGEVESAENIDRSSGGGGSPRGRAGGGGPPAPGNLARAGGIVGKSVIPEKYESPATSGLTATVKPSGNEPLNFDLKDE